MKFQKGNKAAKGGRRNPPGGRPTKEQAAAKESFREAPERKREENAGVLSDKYVEMCLADPAMLRHCVDKVLPTLTEDSTPPIMNVTFLQFAKHQPPQLPPKDDSVPILVPGNRNGHQASAPAVKFLDFSKSKK